jgi:hypothetical protein
MDFSTSNAAFTLHTQDAQRSARDLERRRVIAERMAEAGGQTGGVTEAPVAHRRPRGLLLFSRLGGLRA